MFFGLVELRRKVVEGIRAAVDLICEVGPLFFRAFHALREGECRSSEGEQSDLEFRISDFGETCSRSFRTGARLREFRAEISGCPGCGLCGIRDIAQGVRSVTEFSGCSSGAFYSCSRVFLRDFVELVSEGTGRFCGAFDLLGQSVDFAARLIRHFSDVDRIPGEQFSEFFDLFREGVDGVDKLLRALLKPLVV